MVDFRPVFGAKEDDIGMKNIINKVLREFYLLRDSDIAKKT